MPRCAELHLFCRPPLEQPAAHSGNRHRHPPPPVAGRQHCDCQTEQSIQEALETPQEAAAATQTDAFLPQRLTHAPPLPLAGSDAGTQVAPADLFDWQRDGVPLVEALVGGTLERAVAEAGEELRLKALQHRRRELEEVRGG